MLEGALDSARLSVTGERHFVNPGAPHRHQRELGSDEKRVDQHERENHQHSGGD